MDKGTQTIKGKAFEYACLDAIRRKLAEENKIVKLKQSDQYNTAKGAYDILSQSDKAKYDMAAETAVKLIFPLEPQIENGYEPLILSLSSDAKGKGSDGDVRDVLCIRVSAREDQSWEIGLSCKHNHSALKHPRITEAKDFGKAWLDYPCSQEFIQRMDKIIYPLENMGANGIVWRDVKNKAQEFYVPILEAFIDEFKKICNAHSDAPSKLLSYFFGSKDFYKVISMENVKQTKVMAFNMHGTLNQPAGAIKSIFRVSRLQMPTRLYNIDFKVKGKVKSDTTIVLVFDGGWTVNMRLHNKDEIAKPTSLAWDVTLAGMPPEIYQQQRSWNEK